jgi:hypothetical protein
LSCNDIKGNVMKKVIVGLVVGMLVSTSALAWGEREQGILAGAAGLWAIQQLNKAGQPQGDRVIIQQQQAPVIVQSHPPAHVYRPQQYCESAQVQDQFGQHRMITFCYFK